MEGCLMSLESGWLMEALCRAERKSKSCSIALLEIFPVVCRDDAKIEQATRFKMPIRSRCCRSCRMSRMYFVLLHSGIARRPTSTMLSFAGGIPNVLIRCCCSLSLGLDVLDDARITRQQSC